MPNDMEVEEFTGLMRSTPDVPDAEVERIYREYWKDLVKREVKTSDPDDPVFWEHEAMDPEKVKRELHDFYHVMNTFAVVYCEITGGGLSKLLYEPRVYIDHFNEVAEAWYKENVGDHFSPNLKPRLWEIRHTTQIAEQMADVELEEGEWCLEWIEGCPQGEGWMVGLYCLPAPTDLLAWMDAEGKVHAVGDDPDVMPKVALYENEEAALAAFRKAETVAPHPE